MAFTLSSIPPSFTSHRPSPRTPLARHQLPSCPPQRRIRHTHPSCAASPDAPPTFPVLLDETVTVPSDLSCDRTGVCLVAIKNENLGGRKRRISGCISINAPAERVWRVLTAYSRLSRFLPNIVECTVKTLNGALHVDQVGIISRKLMLRTRMLSRVKEDVARRTLTFTRVEGRDFVNFDAVFTVVQTSDGNAKLQYQLVAVPFPLFPMYLVERKIFKEVPLMLAAVRHEAIQPKHVSLDSS